MWTRPPAPPRILDTGASPAVAADGPATEMPRGEAPHEANEEQEQAAPTSVRFRIATYNVHGCMGTDGRIEEGRIAAVLRDIDADVVALQELDVGRTRSARRDQPRHLADALGMGLHFCESVRRGEELYGHALLSRGPLRLVRAARLPPLRWPRNGEPRSALWADVEVGSQRVTILTTHLGLSPVERHVHTTALLGEDWMGSPAFRGPRVFCGDLNVNSGSRTYQRLRGCLRDVQREAFGRRTRPTFPAVFPMLRLDHVFVSQELRVRRVEVVTTALSRIASDHLPLTVDVEMALPPPGRLS